MSDDIDLTLNEKAAGFVRELLSKAHRESLAAPIRGPSVDGVFPQLESLYLSGLHPGPPAVIPDTNLLRRDIGRVVRRGQRTTLSNAANTGALRLLCPAHVVDEVFEHAEKFSGQMRIGVDDYLRVWRRDYLPLMRVIDEVPAGLLTADEEARVAILQRVDPDDVPAVRLTLAVGGFFLSDDHRALEAVYGNSVDFERHARWVGALKAGGDAHQLGKVLEIGALLSRLVGVGASAAGRKVVTSPSAALFAVGGALAIYARSTPTARAKLTARLGAAGTAILTVFMEYTKANEEIRSLSAPHPGLALESSVSAQGRLTRACLVAFCQSAESTHTAAGLRRLLPTSLAVPHGEAKVRAILRGHGCFHEAYMGHFQLGCPSRDL